MSEENGEVKHFQVGTMKVEIHPSRRSMGAAAALAAAEGLKESGRSREIVAIIFATGASQLETLDALTSIRDLPWNRVRGFHLDEYIGLPADHAASFRGYLRKKLTEKVHMKEFFELDGTAPDPEQVCRDYAEKLGSSDPRLCLLGIGENGHLAFNDPATADFHDPLAVKVVQLDVVCRQQQAAEGWFKTPREVPESAITITIPTLLRVPKLIVSVPGKRKAKIMQRTLRDAISTECPATILRTHPDVTVYLDLDAASDLDGLVPSN
jgi:glucosamine-6-phosphate deaminase